MATSPYLDSRVGTALALVTTLVFIAIYGAGQQILRLSGNDPQIQMAADTAADLNRGASARALIGTTPVLIDSSLAPFIITYGPDGRATSGNGYLDGQLPTPPTGVLQYARDHGQNRLTWQPRTGVRLAAIVVPYTRGYVLAGRSLREIEKREDNLEIGVGLAWLLSLVVIGGAVTLPSVKR